MVCTIQSHCDEFEVCTKQTFWTTTHSHHLIFALEVGQILSRKHAVGSMILIVRQASVLVSLPSKYLYTNRSCTFAEMLVQLSVRVQITTSKASQRPNVAILKFGLVSPANNL